MKRIITILSLVCICFIDLYSQEIISSSGEYFEKPNGSISWTIGEPLSETFTNGNILTQGFHQNEYLASSIYELEENNVVIKISPNPTNNIINLYVENNNDLKYMMFDLNGKVLEEAEIYTEHSKISLSKFNSSVYILIIMKDKKILKSFQIIKL